MKTLNRLLALLCALTLLCSCALAGETSAADQVLATVDGANITLSEVQEAAFTLYYRGYTENDGDYNAAVDALIQQAVMEKRVSELGFDQFTENEMTAFRNDAAIEWESMLNDYIDYYLTEDTQEARAAKREEAIAYYQAENYSEERVLEDMIMAEAFARLEASLVGDYAPTEEEIISVFNQYGAQYQAMYENNVGMYEYYTEYYGYESWYKPEGYRAVLHILLDVDEALLTAYQDAQGAYDDAGSVETPDEATVAAAKEAMDSARAAVVASRQADIDAIYDRLAKGETFQTLIAEYNTDPGMQDEAMLAAGYEVHPESIKYDTAFTEGTFSEKMEKIGDTSDPVVGKYGIHIIYYLGDVPGGLIMTDAIREEIEEFLVASNTNAVYADALPQWEETMTITRDQEAIDALVAAYEANLAAQQEAQNAAAEETAPAEETTPAEDAAPAATDTPAQ